MTSRRTLIQSIAAAVASGKSAAKVVEKEISGIGAGGAAALNAAEVNIPTPGVCTTLHPIAPELAAAHRARRYLELMHGQDYFHPVPAITAIKSYSDWYRAHKLAELRVEPEAHNLSRRWLDGLFKKLLP